MGAVEPDRRPLVRERRMAQLHEFVAAAFEVEQENVEPAQRKYGIEFCSRQRI